MSDQMDIFARRAWSCLKSYRLSLAVNAIGPKLQAIYGGDGRWDDAIGKAVHMPDEMPKAIRDMWARNQKIARDNSVTLTPQQFAEMFVDNNFAD